MSDFSDDDAGDTVVGDAMVLADGNIAFTVVEDVEVTVVEDGDEDIAVVEDHDHEVAVVDDDGPISVVDDDEPLPVMDAPAADVQAEEEVINLDTWVNERALRSIRRYVKQRDPEERVFALSRLPLEQCDWLPDLTLGFDGEPVSVRSVGTVVSTGFYADIYRFPEFAFAIELARPVDKEALANIYAFCDPEQAVPDFFQAFKRMRQRAASFVEVYKATKGIRSARVSPRMPFTCVMVGDVVLVEATLRMGAEGLEFELSKIFLVAEAPIVVD